METVQFQSYVFSFTVYGGVLIGILYDIYRVLKGAKRSEGLITSLWDVVFLAGVLMIAIWTIFSSNYGELRSYVFIGFLVGFFLYEKILSRIAYALFYFFTKSIVSFFKTTNSALLLPFKFLYNLLWYPLAKTGKTIKDQKTKLKKLKKLPQIIARDSKKYYSLIIKRQRKRKKAKSAQS